MLNKSLRKISIIFLTICLTLALGAFFACNENKAGSGTVPENNKKYVELNTTAITLVVGESRDVTAEVVNGKGNEEIVWSSSDEQVAAVDQDGKITAKKIGNASITAKISGTNVTATCAVTIPYVTAQSITLPKTEYYLPLNGTDVIEYFISPSYASKKTVTWVSDAPTIVSVDQEGNIQGLAMGIATITITHVENEGLSSEQILTETCKVTVGKAVEGVTLTADNLEVNINETVRASYTLTPSDCAVKDVIWTSSDESIAKVDVRGKIMGYKEGTVTITVTTVDGGKTDTCTVKVNSVDATDVSLNRTTLSKIVGDASVYLTANVLPENTTNKTVTWTSSNPEVVAVDAEGNLTFLKVGNAVITATTVNGLSAECQVTVNPRPVEAVMLNTEILGIETLVLKIDKTYQLYANITPTAATNKNVTWESSNQGVATVSATGKITAVANGETIITVTTEDGNKSASVKVIVGSPIENMTTPNKTLEVKLESEQTLVVNFTPTEPSFTKLVWTSDKENIVSVDANGKITALVVGTAKITAKTLDGSNKKLEWTIKVVPVTAEQITFEGDITSLPLYEGDIYTLKPVFVPANTTDKTVTWLSSNPSVATVDANGKIIALKSGTAVITATSADGLVTATCNVSVAVKYALFATPTYQPTSSYVINIANLDKVFVDGTALVTGEYTYENNVLSIAKSLIYSKANGAKTVMMQVVDTDASELIISIEIIADGTGFEANQATLVFGERVGVTANMVVDTVKRFGTSSYEVTFQAPEAESENTLQKIEISIEYLSALISAQNTNGITVSYSKDFAGNVVYNGIDANGEVTEKTSDYKIAGSWQQLVVTNETVNALATLGQNLYIGVYTNTHVSAVGKLYLDDVRAITQAELNSAITFEDGSLSPFVSIIGATYEIVDSSELNDGEHIYATSTGYDNGETVAQNKKVLKVTVANKNNAEIRISAFYLQNRLKALGYDYDGYINIGQWKGEYGLNMRIIAEGSDNSIYTGWAMDFNAGFNGFSVSTLSAWGWHGNASGGAANAFMFMLSDFYTNAVDQTTHSVLQTEYYSIKPHNSNCVFYIDDIGAFVRSDNKFQANVKI